ncbi:MlaD family protein [Mycolicibacterium septicum]|uniref:MlaD family protein n=1 Tax=Mycolicibacterium septicum TaxID=98668 RepID=UPI00235FE155|nr:MlaD family protein [Mycolicibacterium septicum]
MKLLRNPLFSGAASLATVMVVALVAAWLHISPPGQTIVTFYTTDAASIRPGDQVRIAGVSVGEVKDLAIGSNQVRVRAQVDGNQFVGDQSHIEVRMLTVVGGYYVNLIPLGEKRLGSIPIPVEHVTMPYNLMRTLVDATKITDNVKPKPINESLNQVQAGLAGNNVETISAIIDAGNSLMSTIDKQRGQVTAILNLSDEYIRALSEFRGGLKDIVRKVSILEATLVLYSKGFGDTLDQIGKVSTGILVPLADFYANHREEFLSRVRDWLAKARMWSDRNGAVIRTLRLFRNKIERVVDAQNAAPEVLATDLCMPIPGSPC